MQGPLLINGVHVWTLRTSTFSENRTDLLTILSPDEQHRATAFRFERDRLSFISTRAALRMILAQCLQKKPESLVFRVNAQGKPSLEGSGLQFSVSHSADRAVIALSRQFPVGVDVEHVRPGIPHQDIAKRFFSDRDNQWLQRNPAPESTDFFRLWVIKEAFVKCIGLGLSFPLEDFEVNFVDSRCHGIRWLGHEEHEFSVTELKLWEGFTSALVIQQSL